MEFLSTKQNHTPRATTGRKFFEDMVLHPCYYLEVLHICQDLNLNLPKSYVDFLLDMGHGAGSFLKGSDCFYDDLINIQKWARALLIENNFPLPLPDKAFVFLMHQGYQFSFMDLAEGYDPPVYSYCEGQKEQTFIKTADKFGDFLATEIAFHKSIDSALEHLELSGTRAIATKT